MCLLGTSGSSEVISVPHGKMLDIPMSHVAWLSVVVIQALIHYFVFGMRRVRIQKEEEPVYETLSLSTNDSFADLDSDPVPVTVPTQDALTAAAAAASSSYLAYIDNDDLSEEDNPFLSTEPSTAMSSFSSIVPPCSPRVVSHLIDPSPYELMQTGKDILRVSLEFLVVRSDLHKFKSFECLPHHFFATFLLP